MRTCIDGSCFLTPHPTGVTIAAQALLRSGQLDIEGGEVVSYRLEPPTTEQKAQLPFSWTHKRVPSRLIHALCASGVSSFDRLFGPMDRLFLPNLNIVGTPHVPYDLLVHDISFLLQPSWFSLKTRIWHTCARPISLMRGADRLFTVSEWTKRDLVEVVKIPEERINVIDIIPTSSLIVPQPRPISEPYFLLFSAHDERKNAAVARIAFDAFSHDFPTWKLVLVGAKGPSHTKNVLHLPYLAPQEHERWLQHAAALLYPSWYEGFGLPAHEATHRHIPVLAAGNDALAETAPTGTVLLP
ncbi:glycosyltransferase, partial [Patescibacteria group bacterium]|nr:glycosyltransferase [Patescibacteria group bacterium]